MVSGSFGLQAYRLTGTRTPLSVAPPSEVGLIKELGAAGFWPQARSRERGLPLSAQ